MAIEVIEEFSEPRKPGGISEDRIAVTRDFAVVVDGAGDPTRRMIGGLSVGARAAESIIAVFSAALPTTTVAEMVRLCSNRVREIQHALNATGMTAVNPPAASFVAVSSARRELWRVGDCGFLMHGKANFPMKDIQRLFAEVRSFMVLADGVVGHAAEPDNTNAELIEVMKLLTKRQHIFENANSRTGFEFGVIDGETVPERFIECFEIGSAPIDIVLASDGYPVLASTLEETEALLRDRLRDDPLCIGLNRGQKPSVPGGSYDDRSFLRIRA